MGDLLAPERPREVPSGATYLPPAQDFDALKQMAKDHGVRSYLRVWFPFVVLRIRGPLQRVDHRSLTVRPSRTGQYVAWCFTGSDLLPGMWVWTLADERWEATDV